VIAFLIVCAGIVSCDAGSPAGQRGKLPNILFIVADDLGWQDLGIYGNTQINTPNIDALAASGAKFNNAFVVAPSCSSSRAALMTGQYPHTNKVTALTHRYPSKALRPFYTTLASLLEDNGYRTGIDGKWHVAPYYPTSFYGYQERMLGLGVFADDWKISNAEDALEFIHDSVEDNSPFYLELNFIQNHRRDHGKFYYSDEFPVDAGSIKVPQNYSLPDWPEIREDLARFYSQTMEMDAIVGDIVAALDALEIRQSTLIIFVSDNGQPYPGAKMTLYDRGTGTPLIANWQGTIAAGLQINPLISSIDIMPSILHAVGIDVPEAVQGMSFLPLIALQGRGGDNKYTERAAVFTELDYHVNYLPTRSVRTNQWKYIRNYTDSAVGLDELGATDWAIRLAKLPDQPWLRPRVEEELYYLPDDPHETVNLATNQHHQKVKARLGQLLTEHMRDTSDPALGQEFSPDVINVLQ